VPRSRPEALGTEQVPITDLLAAVTAFAVREAIADPLLLAGFELLAGAATVALISRNAAGVGDCGRMWLQPSSGCPPTWSKFDRSPVVPARSATLP